MRILNIILMKRKIKMLGKSNSKLEKEFNSKIRTLEQRILNLKKEVDRKPSQDVNEAKAALSKCSEYKNRSNESYQEIERLHKKYISNAQELEGTINHIKNSEEFISKINKLSLATEERINSLEEAFNSMSSLYEEKEDLDNKVRELNLFYEKGEESSSKISAIYSILKNVKMKLILYIMKFMVIQNQLRQMMKKKKSLYLD